MSLLKQLLDRLSPWQHNIYLISDTHFSEDDLRICCDRPFQDISEMDTIMADNWNATIQKDDTVYFLGDWGKNMWYWRNYLNGKKLSIKGNHDHGTRAPYTRILKRKYLLVHDPSDVEHYYPRWAGWVIHGHHHDNVPKKYPFINGIKKNH
jgi:calcineurin-like phosphoesterase family protein